MYVVCICTECVCMCIDGVLIVCINCIYACSLERRDDCCCCCFCFCCCCWLLFGGTSTVCVCVAAISLY